MALTSKERFQIALAKFLGLNPTKDRPLGEAPLCDDWLLSECLRIVVPDESGQIRLGKETFDRLMLLCGRNVASQAFFDYFFHPARTIDEFEEAVDIFRRAAMWLFGNFRFAYRKLATCDREEFERWIKKTRPRSSRQFEEREPFSDIEKIPVEDLPLLGYVSAQELKDLKTCLDLIRALPSRVEEMAAALAQIGAEKQRKIADVLKKRGLQFPESGIGSLNELVLSDLTGKISTIVNPLRRRAEGAETIGRRNTHRYLSLPHMDVYVATSMRIDQDFVDQHAFIRDLFENNLIKPLRLRFFDPTISYVDDRITKGLIECLMIRRASVTVYNASHEDSLGKDSELAATLAQGKPVIVYVPTAADSETQKKLDRRANIFRADHPLGLQLDLRTGVTHGVIVVRSPEECAEMLRKVLLNELEFQIIHEGGNFKLVEVGTKSVLRVVSDDPHLTHVFWSYFHKSAED